MGKASVCKSIFQNGKAEPEQRRLTEVWIQLINEMERSKTHLTGTQSAQG